jgi:hypothetical protein
MSDLRARIADALCAFLADYNNTGVVHLTEGVDRLLSLPGIAIVELPDAQQDNEFYQIWFTKCGNVLISKDQNKLIFKEWHRTPSDLRTLAAALLAAADSAEAQ